MADTVPQFFDTHLARHKLARAYRHQPAFLAESIAAEIEQRMGMILHDFPLTVIQGYGAQEVTDRMVSTSRFRQIIIGDSHMEASPGVVFDPEALPFAPQSLDCIISILALQAVNDLPGALVQMRKALRPDGLLLACLFAGDTLNELRTSWLAAESEEREGASPRVAPFADIRDLGGLLQRAGFALPVADADRTIVRYPSALALMREIKALGFGNSLIHRSRRPVTRMLLTRAAASYERRFADADGRVRATVEIAWLTGWTPHESQQQPLRPGSAKARLADALKVPETRLPRD